MATINSTTERRYIPDRRANGVGTTTSNRTAGTQTQHGTTSRRMSAVDWIAMTLLIVGGLNWGLIGLFSFDLVAALFGAMTTLSRIVYTLVGLSALWAVYTSIKMSGDKT